MLTAFKKIFKKTELKPVRIQSDGGAEFTNLKLRKFLKENGVIYNSTRNPDTKASICERSIRTLKGRIFKYFTHSGSLKFIDKLDDFVDAYNNSYHRTIKMAPVDVNERNILQVFNNITQSQKPRKRKRPKKN